MTQTRPCGAVRRAATSDPTRDNSRVTIQHAVSLQKQTDGNWRVACSCGIVVSDVIFGMDADKVADAHVSSAQEVDARNQPIVDARHASDSHLSDHEQRWSRTFDQGLQQASLLTMSVDTAAWIAEDGSLLGRAALKSAVARWLLRRQFVADLRTANEFVQVKDAGSHYLVTFHARLEQHLAKACLVPYPNPLDLVSVQLASQAPPRLEQRPAKGVEPRLCDHCGDSDRDAPAMEVAFDLPGAGEVVEWLCSGCGPYSENPDVYCDNCEAFVGNSGVAMQREAVDREEAFEYGYEDVLDRPPFIIDVFVCPKCAVG